MLGRGLVHYNHHQKVLYYLDLPFGSF